MAIKEMEEGDAFDVLEPKRESFHAKARDTGSLSFATMNMNCDVGPDGKEYETMLLEIGEKIRNTVTHAIAADTREDMLVYLEDLQAAIPQHFFSLKKRLSSIPNFSLDIINESSQMKNWTPQTVLLMARKFAATTQELSDEKLQSESLKQKNASLERALKKKKDEVAQIRRSIYQELVILKTNQCGQDPSEIMSLFQMNDDKTQLSQLRRMLEADKTESLERLNSLHKKSESIMEKELLRLASENSRLSQAHSETQEMLQRTNSTREEFGSLTISDDDEPSPPPAPPPPPPPPIASPPPPKRTSLRRIPSEDRNHRNTVSSSEFAKVKADNNRLNALLNAAQSRVVRLETQIQRTASQVEKKATIPKTVSMPPERPASERNQKAAPRTVPQKVPIGDDNASPTKRRRLLNTVDGGFVENKELRMFESESDDDAVDVVRAAAEAVSSRTPLVFNSTTIQSEGTAEDITSTLSAVETMQRVTPRPPSGHIGMAVLLPAEELPGAEVEGAVLGVVQSAAERHDGMFLRDYPCRGGCAVVTSSPKQAETISSNVLTEIAKSGDTLRVAVGSGDALPVITPTRVEYHSPMVQEVARRAQGATPNQLTTRTNPGQRSIVLEQPHLAGPASVVWMHCGAVVDTQGEEIERCHLMVRSCAHGCGGVAIALTGNHGECAHAFPSAPAAVAFAMRATGSLRTIEGTSLRWSAAVAQASLFFTLNANGAATYHGKALSKARLLSETVPLGNVLCSISDPITTLSYAQSLMPAGEVIQIHTQNSGVCLLTSEALPAPTDVVVLGTTFRADIVEGPLPPVVESEAELNHAVAGFLFETNTTSFPAKCVADAWSILCVLASCGGGALFPEACQLRGCAVFATIEAAYTWALRAALVFEDRDWGCKAPQLSCYIARIRYDFDMEGGLVQTEATLSAEIARRAVHCPGAVVVETEEVAAHSIELNVDLPSGHAAERWEFLLGDLSRKATFVASPWQGRTAVSRSHLTEPGDLPCRLGCEVALPPLLRLEHTAVATGVLTPKAEVVWCAAVVKAVAQKLGGAVAVMCSVGEVSYVASFPKVPDAFAFAIKIVDALQCEGQGSSRHVLDVVSLFRTPGAIEQLDVSGCILDHCEPDTILMTSATRPSSCLQIAVLSEVSAVPVVYTAPGTMERCHICAFTLPPKKLSVGVTLVAVGDASHTLTLPPSVPHAARAGWWQDILYRREVPPIGADTFTYASITSVAAKDVDRAHRVADGHEGCIVRVAEGVLGGVFPSLAALISFVLNCGNGAAKWNIGVCSVEGTDTITLHGAHDAPWLGGHKCSLADALAGAAQEGEMLLHGFKEFDVARSVRDSANVTCPPGVVTCAHLIRVNLFHRSNEAVPPMPLLPPSVATPPEGFVAFACISADADFVLPGNDMAASLAIVRYALHRCLRAHGQGGVCVVWGNGTALLCCPNPSAAVAVCLSLQEMCLVELDWPESLLSHRQGRDVQQSELQREATYSNLIHRGLRLRCAVWVSQAAQCVANDGVLQYSAGSLHGAPLTAYAASGIILVEPRAMDLVDTTRLQWGASLALLEEGVTTPHGPCTAILPALHRARNTTRHTPLTPPLNLSVAVFTPPEPRCGSSLTFVGVRSIDIPAVASTLRSCKGNRIVLDDPEFALAWFASGADAVSFAGHLALAGAGCGVSCGSFATEHYTGGTRVYGTNVGRCLRLAAIAPQGVVFGASKVGSFTTEEFAWGQSKHGDMLVLTPHQSDTTPLKTPLTQRTARRAERATRNIPKELNTMMLCFVEAHGVSLVKVAGVVADYGFEVRREANYVLAVCDVSVEERMLVEVVRVTHDVGSSASSSSGTNSVVKSMRLTAADRFVITPSGACQICGPTPAALALRIRDASKEKVFDLTFGCYFEMRPVPHNAEEATLVALHFATEDVKGEAWDLSLRLAAGDGVLCAEVEGALCWMFAFRTHGAAVGFVTAVRSVVYNEGDRRDVDCATTLRVAVCVMDSPGALSEDVQALASVVPQCAFGEAIASSRVMTALSLEQNNPPHHVQGAVTFFSLDIAAPRDGFPRRQQWVYHAVHNGGAAEWKGDEVDTRELLLIMDLGGRGVGGTVLHDVRRATVAEALRLFDSVQVHPFERSVERPHLSFFLVAATDARDMAIWLHLRFLAQPYPVDASPPSQDSTEAWDGWVGSFTGRGATWRGPALQICIRTVGSDFTSLSGAEMDASMELMHRACLGHTLVSEAAWSAMRSDSHSTAFLPFQVLLGATSFTPVWKPLEAGHLLTPQCLIERECTTGLSPHIAVNAGGLTSLRQVAVAVRVLVGLVVGVRAPQCAADFVCSEYLRSHDVQRDRICRALLLQDTAPTAHKASDLEDMVLDLLHYALRQLAANYSPERPKEEVSPRSEAAPIEQHTNPYTPSAINALQERLAAAEEVQPTQPGVAKKRGAGDGGAQHPWAQQYSARPLTAGVGKLAAASVRYTKKRSTLPDIKEMKDVKEKDIKADTVEAAGPVPPVQPPATELDFRKHVSNLRTERRKTMFSPLSSAVRHALAS